VAISFSACVVVRSNNCSIIDLDFNFSVLRELASNLDLDANVSIFLLDHSSLRSKSVAIVYNILRSSVTSFFVGLMAGDVTLTALTFEDTAAE
jgi:hypothetical protein